jgi:hypothetical protein
MKARYWVVLIVLLALGVGFSGFSRTVAKSVPIARVVVENVIDHPTAEKVKILSVKEIEGTFRTEALTTDDVKPGDVLSLYWIRVQTAEPVSRLGKPFRAVKE